VYYNVDYIHTAIYENKQIKFHYAEWTVEKKLKLKKMEPSTLSWDDENYYLVAYDATVGIIKHYRVDKMWDTEILEADRKGEESFKKLISVSSQFFGWLTGVGSGMRIVGPEDVK